jgi:hypothetical protein
MSYYITPFDPSTSVPFDKLRGPTLRMNGERRYLIEIFSLFLPLPFVLSVAAEQRSRRTE